MPEKVYLVSACLLGVRCRYDGGHNLSEPVLRFLSGRRFVPVCPEQLGGLPTPRKAAEIKGGDGHDVLQQNAAVIRKDALDLTAAFLKGAEQTLLLARLCRADCAILKANSPSCGSGRIHDGSFQGCFRAGDGVTAALLKQNNIPIFNEYYLPTAKD